MKNSVKTGIVQFKKIILFLILLCIIGIAILLNQGNFLFVRQGRNESSEPFMELWKKNPLKQVFISSVDDLESIDLLIATYEKNIKNRTVEFTLYDEEEREITKEQIASEKIKDNSFVRFSFPKQENSKGKKYKFTLTCNDCTEKDLFAIYGVEKKNVEEYAEFGGQKTEYQTTMILSGKTTPDVAILICLCIILIATSYLLYKKMETFKNKKWFTLLKKEYILFPLYFIMALIFSVALYKAIYFSNYLFNFHLFYHLVLFISLEILIFLIFITIYKEKIKIEKLFLLLAIPIGLCYLVLIIPNYVADELIHYTSAYKLTEGIIRDTGDYVDIPAQVSYNHFTTMNHYKRTNYQELDSYIRQAPTKEEAKSTATEYFPMLYFPQAIAIGSAKILNLPYVLGYYFARLLNFICFLVFGYFTIKRIPIGKPMMAVYLLNPMFLHQAISVSADCLINSLSLFYIAYILYLNQKDTSFTKKEYMWLILLILIISILKYVYIPLVLLGLVLLFKKKDFVTKKQKQFLLITISASVFICVSLYILHAMVPIKVLTDVSIENTASLTLQLHNLLYHPWMIIEVFIKTLQSQGTFYLETFLGARLGWLNILVPMLWIDLYLIILLCSPFLIKEKQNYDKKTKIAMLCVFLIIFLMIIFGMYLTWTPVGAKVVEGVQGRYFLPIAILPLLLLCDTKRYLQFKHPVLIISLLLGLIHTNIIVTIIQYFL